MLRSEEHWMIASARISASSGVTPLRTARSSASASDLFEYKFYPVFCICFGYGFAVQTRRWAASGANVDARFTRRMNFMFLMGVLHGVLLWFGDILARYAIAGYLLRRHLSKGPRALLKAIKFWLIAAVVSGVAFAWVAGAAAGGGADAGQQRESAQIDGERTFETYTESGYVDATIQRARDFLAVTALYVFALPQLMPFFLLGALAAQLQWLRYPSRYRPFWQRVFWLALLIGLPVNIAFAVTQVSVAANPWIPASMPEALLATFAPLLALAYVAAFALLRASVPGKALIRLFAPAGRVALTLYIGQSVAMTLLLNGFGLGLGATFGQLELFLTAVLIFGCMLVLAHLMQRFAIPAPLELLWRRYTNAPASHDKHT